MARKAILLLTVVATVLLLLVSRIPLGVPDEWVWRRQLLPHDLLEALDRLAVPAIVGAILYFFAKFVDRRIERSSKFVCGLFVGLLVVASYSWINAARQAAATPHRELRPLWVLYDRFASGYFFEAAFHIQSADELLAGYEKRMAKGDVLHEGTHPPGLFLLNYWAIKAAERHEWLTTVAELTISKESASVFRTMETNVRTARPLSRHEFAALCLVSFLSTLMSAMTVIPVYAMVGALSNRQTAWRAACIMVTIPGIAVFAPRSDIVYAFSATLIPCLFVLAALAGSSLTRILWSTLAGLTVFVSLTVSLAHIPVLVACSLFFVANFFGPETQRIPVRHMITTGVVSLLVFMLAVAAWSYETGCFLPRVWIWNLSNHAGFYKQSPRTWWKWFLVNPLELAFSIGLPLSYVFCGSMGRAIRELWNAWTAPDRSSVSGKKIILIRLALCLFLTWSVLWLSGKNMGEAARLWCFLTPWFVIGASLGPGANSSSQSSEQNHLQRKSTELYDSSLWPALLAAQMVVCTVTVGGVSGYQELTNFQG